MKTLISTLTLLLFFASNGLSQSLYSVRPDQSGSFLSEDFGLEGSDEEEAENTADGVVDESLELRMRYPELYGGNLAAGSNAGDDADETVSGVDESLETQTRYPELYLDNRLYDEDGMLTIERGEP